MANARLGLAMRFVVVVDDINLGGWASCAGLSVDFTNKPIKEGANYGYQPILPDRVQYKTITLKRAMSKDDSAAVQKWLAQVVNQWYGGMSVSDYSGRTARISLYDASGTEVGAWSLRNVFPRQWSGPDLDASGNKVAVETLQLVHEGFL
jgi:phage tail-like protein